MKLLSQKVIFQLKTIEWKDEKVILIDQLKLPTELNYIECKNPNRIAKAIKTLEIRGAPAIGIAAAMALALTANNSKTKSKEELFKGTLGLLIANLNVFPIKGQPGELMSLRRAIKELEAGRALAIFPEGRRTPDGRLGEPMPGVGLLAAKTGVCIVPAFIEGSNRALPIDSKFIRLKKIKVYFGKVLWPQELSPGLNSQDFYQGIAARTMEEIGRLKPRAKNDEN